jgi:hypothetical protein
MFTVTLHPTKIKQEKGRKGVRSHLINRATDALINGRAEHGQYLSLPLQHLDYFAR